MTATVTRIAPPAALRARSTLGRVDYADTFVVAGAAAQARSAEGWLRAMLTEAPAPLRAQLVTGWLAIGLAVHPGRPGTLLGWRLAHSEPGFALLATGSRIGMPAQLALERREDEVRFATFVHQRSAVSRGLWPRIVPLHVRTVSGLLGAAARRVDRDRPAA